MGDQYFGPYRAIVIDNDDPHDRLRLRVRVPDLFGDLDVGWALPCVPPGATAVPDVGASRQDRTVALSNLLCA